jgi:hypothetical protein
MNNADRRDPLSLPESSDAAGDILSLKPSALKQALRVRSGVRCGKAIECCETDHQHPDAGGAPPPPPVVLAI